MVKKTNKNSGRCKNCGWKADSHKHKETQEEAEIINPGFRYSLLECPGYKQERTAFAPSHLLPTKEGKISKTDGHFFQD
jgi:hypothetical protein